MTTQDRRKFQRLDHKMLLSYEQFDGTTDLKEAEGMAITKDFSLGGFEIELPNPPDPGDFIKATLNFDGLEMNIVAEVMRVRPNERGTYDAGVRLIRAPAQFGEVVAYYIRPQQDESGS